MTFHEGAWSVQHSSSTTPARLKTLGVPSLRATSGIRSGIFLALTLLPLKRVVFFPGLLHTTLICNRPSQGSSLYLWKILHPHFARNGILIQIPRALESQQRATAGHFSINSRAPES